ncbi:hypothetical protein FRACYDRAFT_256212 [Fragilariopsis cylindrus CCMP1102]|uniref:Uncharacterized protein n=1 Tax=Fragilariopsis cylindrus CCMP1102 TaxID=635003 RepID=A0A1E7EJV7_9STRA|nr:hypothetical protein FRACYDRAFT_256212 [Fragilariopsis cylindrus CCMP1102]|eukprot:OEU06158.1 hypothetical protein FRACYDRAFT_256212 [Fragilariopsis cylindrus CCMP1102]
MQTEPNQKNDDHKVTLKDVATKLGKQGRTKSFRERWSILKNQKGYIGTSKISGAGFFELTLEGIEHAQTDEYKEMMKEMNLLLASVRFFDLLSKNKKGKSVKEELKDTVPDIIKSETVPDIIKSEKQKSVKEELKVKDEESEEKGDDDDDDNDSTAASSTGNNNNEDKLPDIIKSERQKWVNEELKDTVPDIIKSVKPEQIIEGSKNADLVNVALVHDEGKQQNGDDTNEAGPSDIPQFIGSEPVTNSSELLSDKVKVEATKNKETTSHKNNKRQRIKYEYLA